MNKPRIIVDGEDIELVQGLFLQVKYYEKLLEVTDGRN